MNNIKRNDEVEKILAQVLIFYPGKNDEQYFRNLLYLVYITGKFDGVAETMKKMRIDLSTEASHAS